jgi:hypothetical protein
MVTVPIIVAVSARKALSPMIGATPFNSFMIAISLLLYQDKYNDFR